MLNEKTAALAPDGQPFQLTTLQNLAGMRVSLMDWGATWLSCQLPVPGSGIREVLLGCASPEQYPQQQAYLGASIGRYANRIANAAIHHGDEVFHLIANQGEHQLHGGPEGFHTRRWRILNQDASQVTYQLNSPDGDQGFPGQLNVQVCYRLTEHNALEIEYQAVAEKPCPVCLTNHAYFNLDGSQTDSRKHQLQLFADYYLPVNSAGIPGDSLAPVKETGMDFRQPKSLAKDFLRDRDQIAVGGYDHAYLLHRTCGSSESPAANLWSSDGRVMMSVFTSAPALQLYSGNFLAGTPSREGGAYENYAGIALESEFLPDSPNHPDWPQPDCWLKPGKVYRSDTTYQFFSQ
ncbi:galactose-1-epimerase [Brenneria goodwinii]|uniref:galactose-1-epimerase n=1 Tax=Brenneria goodwinii TaxID=1109412 RepID=UPI000EF1B6F4|nr:galactose-1-epimerase [Brenneria goodwinii]MCG8156843.1 galactose-1-epimerase [Brenneria goodwinii]MCG8163485.1 galactose-1-epimerase [Brenneria goodwinii]MCG8165683.1 galactose-1-epimerase [Brenneria goodwinii]MCG8170171.1 galactose-1-epimerase [Brenneria goodwinii]MCG8174381.1 galactose-1-epimerase [Brenneria goodwinii]